MYAITTNRPDYCAQAVEQLYSVLDPEMGVSVIDLGLIEQIDVDVAAQKIYCRMTLTTAFCPLGEAITNRVQQALQETFPNFSAAVTLDFDSRWTPDRISEAGKSILDR
ncbi:MAG: metal-sulfur cluster assembly factor [Bacteroidetes bacterium]|jgi:Predicted metal-sulfur cluster biosynthetic enzyme|uniref:metal-sulfur cluster assembly factor n=1 Tax=Phnomibacter sp. TaxID=2836217 RepID=UPI002FDDA397|nr:metal-sulfur cluster assembly factor [Bacteroidota bacterium]